MHSTAVPRRESRRRKMEEEEVRREVGEKPADEKGRSRDDAERPEVVEDVASEDEEWEDRA